MALLVVLMIVALPGCMTLAPKKPHGPDRTLRSAAVQRGLNDRPTKQGPKLAGSREKEIVRGQDPGTGGASGVSPATSAPVLP